MVEVESDSVRASILGNFIIKVWLFGEHTSAFVSLPVTSTCSMVESRVMETNSVLFAARTFMS
jgi:hypothetical protein